jgi:hypothetical protein
MTLFSLAALAQENSITLSGGYVFTNIENADVDATGFRINGNYEFIPAGGNFAHGFSAAYIQTSADVTDNVSYKLTHVPFYYSPKFMFGSESFKGFLKGALGTHSSWYKREGAIGELETMAWGFYGGASLGAMKIINEKLFINVEYEWAYLSNTSYSDGFVNSIMGGLGFRF